MLSMTTGYDDRAFRLFRSNGAWKEDDAEQVAGHHLLSALVTDGAAFSWIDNGIGIFEMTVSRESSWTGSSPGDRGSQRPALVGERLRCRCGNTAEFCRMKAVDSRSTTSTRSCRRRQTELRTAHRDAAYGDEMAPRQLARHH